MVLLLWGKKPLNVGKIVSLFVKIDAKYENFGKWCYFSRF